MVVLEKYKEELMSREKLIREIEDLASNAVGENNCVAGVLICLATALRTNSEVELAEWALQFSLNKAGLAAQEGH